MANASCRWPQAVARPPRPSQKIQAATAKTLFPHSRAPEAALSGLYLYFSCRDEAHEAAQSIHTPDGAYWHGIVHRQEPDPDNAGYWFRRVGSHPIFPEVAADGSSDRTFEPRPCKADGTPFAFVAICERARREAPSPLTQMALETQRAEWQILFDYCARGRSTAL